MQAMMIRRARLLRLLQVVVHLIPKMKRECKQDANAESYAASRSNFEDEILTQGTTIFFKLFLKLLI